MKDNKCEFLH
jgi:hypothetical protein